MSKCPFCTDPCNQDWCEYSGKSKTRKDFNLEILELLKDKIEKNPDLRFNQILFALGLNPDKDFYEESEITLDKITKSANKKE
jgi:2-iminoacetate synthase ThiH